MQKAQENRDVLAGAWADQEEYVSRVIRLNEEAYTRTGVHPKALVHSFGCQQNVSDGEKLKGMLVQMGYQPTDELDEADVVLYNTCAVRENAEDRVYGLLGQLKHNKEKKPSMIIGLCGCMVQQEHVADRIRRSYRHVDLVFGTHVMHTLPRLLWEAATSGHMVVDITDSENGIVEGLPVVRGEGAKAWVPVMYGCDNFCTYCVVPYVRGRERSRESAQVVQEVRELVAQGYKEVMLLGQNVNSYGKGLAEEIDFSGLLEKVNGIEGDFRIRFMTSHPKDASKRLFETMARCEKVCKHLHLPVQCGSNRILERMNRRYSVEEYLRLIDDARSAMPGISFSSDIIVGFPGETYEDFSATLALIRQVRYDSLYTFIYSPRRGTKAAQMEDPISREEKGIWFRELLGVQEEIGAQRLASYVGRTLRVLVEGYEKTGEGLLTGRSEENAVVCFPGDASLIGQFVQVRARGVRRGALVGEIAPQQSGSSV